MQSPRWLCGTASLSLIALMLSGNSLLFAAPTSPKSAPPAKPAKNTKKQQAKSQAKTVAPGSLTTADLHSVSRLKAKISYFSAQDKRRQALEREDEDELEQREAYAKRGEKVPAKAGEEEGEEDESITSYLEAYMFYLKQRAFPSDKIDTAALYRASQYRKTMPRFNALNDRFKASAAAAGEVGVNGLPQAGINWEFIGPKNLTTPYQIYYGPATSATSGRVNGLGFHPTNSQIAYLAAGGGGVWKTLDGGMNWANISSTFPTQNTGPVLVDPKNPDTVYIGLGDYKGYRGPLGGIIKTVDGGANWTVLDPSNTDLGQTFISALAIDPDDSTRIIASGGRSGGNGVYLSTNSGGTWSRVQPGDFSVVSISPKKTTPTDPTIKSTRFYYASADFNGIYRSQDKGATWQPIRPQPVSSGGYMQAVASTVDANVVYVIDSGSQKIYKGIRNASSDRYAWSDISFGFPGDYNWSQAFYDMHLEAVPQKVGPTTLTDVLYNGLITFSAKRGVRDWQDVGITYQGNARTHNDQHSFAAFPGDNRKMMFGNDGGVYGLTYDDVNGTYTIADTLSRTLGITMFYHADFHPTDPTRAIGGTQDNATPLLNGNFEKWDNVGGGDGGGVVIDPTHPTFQYTTSQNGGFYWTPNNWVDRFYDGLPLIKVNNKDVNDAPFVATIAVDPLNPSDVFFGGNNYMHRYRNPRLGGNGWQTKLGDFDFGSQILAINVPPSDRPIIFSGTVGGKLFLSANDGASWQDITENLPGRSITDIWVNPKNINDVIVTMSGSGIDHVWRTKNALLPFPKWASISGASGTPLPDIPTNAITNDPFDTTGATLYVGTDIGIFATMDGGLNWADASTSLGFPNVQVTALRAMPNTGYLMAATYGRGMYRLPLSGFKFETNTAFTAGPNPALPGQVVTMTATITNPKNKAVSPTGSVTFRDGTRNLGIATLDATGTATFSTTTLAKGTHTLTANYTGDKNNAASTSTAIVLQVGYNTTTSLVSSVNPSTVKQKVTFTANIASVTPGGPAPTGNVRFLDGTTTLGTKPVDSTGVATLDVTSLLAGSHSITAEYVGDTNYFKSASTALTQVVNKITTTLSLTSSKNPANAGDSVRFLAKINRPNGSPVPTGTITFLDGRTELATISVNSAGEAALNISSLPAGNHPITARYDGDQNYNPATSTGLNQSVNKNEVTLALSSSNNPAKSGENVRFLVKISRPSDTSPVVTGTITFLDGNTALATVSVNTDGEAALDTSSLTAGNHPITARYNGDPNYNQATSGLVNQVITQPSATINLSANPTQVTVGQPSTLTATVTTLDGPVTSGTVTFLQSDTPIATRTVTNGTVTLPVTFRLAGKYTFTAVYTSDGNTSNAQSQTVTITVTDNTTE